MRELTVLCCTRTKKAIPGVDPRDIQGNSTGFPDFCCQFLVRHGALDLFALLRQDTPGITHGICNITGKKQLTMFFTLSPV